MYKMNPEFKQPWIDALRSGEYKQLTGVLERVRTADQTVMGNCCLGVLCRVAGIPSSPATRTVGYFGYGEKSVSVHFGGASSSLTRSLREKFGISDEASTALINMNDAEEKDFNQIADYIEQNL